MHIKLQFNFALTGQSCIGTIKVLFWYFGLRCDICLCFTWIFFMFLVLIWLPYISLACLLHLLTGLFVYLSLNIYLGLKINIHLWFFYSPQRLFLLNCSPSSLYKIMYWSNCDVIIYLMRVLVPSKENTACLCFRSWNWLIPIIRLLYMNCFVF